MTALYAEIALRKKGEEGHVEYFRIKTEHYRGQVPPGIARLLLDLVAMLLLLGTLGCGLAGACEPEHTLFSDYKWLASNWMFIHALICCVCLPLFLRALSTQGKEGFPNLLISPPQSNPEGGGQTPPRLLLSFCISI